MRSSVASNVGRRIVLLRHRLGLSQTVIARLAGISRNALVDSTVARGLFQPLASGDRVPLIKLSLVVIASPRRLSTMLKVHRTRQGLSQSDLAKREKVRQGYIAMLESGERKNPSLPVLRRLAKALGVPVTALLE
jgi:transcriptional regulator with XRE-family HTH domain